MSTLTRGCPDEKDDRESVPDQWVSINRSRSKARRVAILKHPLGAFSSMLLRKRGMSSGTEPSSADQILQKVAKLPLSVWTYGFDHPSVRHLGPMAQDFASAFGLGSSGRRIDAVDAHGVALASIQALYRRVMTLESEAAELRSRLEVAEGRAGTAGLVGDDRTSE